MYVTKVQHEPGDFLCKMRDDIWGADGECTIEHAQAEHKSVPRVSCIILPFSPHKVRRGIATTLRVGQDSADDNGNDQAREDKKPSEGFDCRKCLVCK
jgi:hypothetical protein